MKYAWMVALIVGQGPWVEPDEQERLEKIWPVEKEGFRFYKRTNYSQRVAVTNNRPTIAMYRHDQDDYWTNSPPAFNPNRDFPWAMSGGMDKFEGWKSHPAIFFPWGGKLEMTKEGFSGGRVKHVWTYPVGTKFADMLVHDGSCFELRVREKKEDGWHAMTVFRGNRKPEGYTGPGKKCASCHDRAGEAIQYGITVRGSDTVFSFSPFIEGTQTPFKDKK